MSKQSAHYKLFVLIPDHIRGIVIRDYQNPNCCLYLGNTTFSRSPRELLINFGYAKSEQTSNA